MVLRNFRFFLRIAFSSVLSISLIWQPVAIAKTSIEKETSVPSISWKKIVDETGLNGKSVRVDDVYSKYKSVFPLFLQSHIEEMLRLDPDWILPKFSIYTVPNKKGGEDLQVSYADDDRAISMTFLTEEKVIRVGDEKITYEDWLDGVAMEQKLERGTGIGDKWAWLISPDSFKIKILEFEQFKSSTMIEKKDYINIIHEIVNQSEALYRRPENFNESEKTSWLSDVLINVANAEVKAGEPCLIAGQVGTFKKSYLFMGALQCYVDDKKKSCSMAEGGGKGVLCNEKLYGDNHCVSPKNASEDCKTKAGDWMPANADEWKALQSELKSVLNLTSEGCKKFPDGGSDQTKAQAQAHKSCMEVLKRIEAINKNFEEKTENENEAKKKTEEEKIEEEKKESKSLTFKERVAKRKALKEARESKVKWYRKPWVLLTGFAIAGGVLGWFLWNWLAGPKAKDKSKKGYNFSPFSNPYYFRGLKRSRTAQ